MTEEQPRFVKKYFNDNFHYIDKLKQMKTISNLSQEKSHLQLKDFVFYKCQIFTKYLEK